MKFNSANWMEKFTNIIIIFHDNYDYIYKIKYKKISNATRR